MQLFSYLLLNGNTCVSNSLSFTGAPIAFSYHYARGFDRFAVGRQLIHEKYHEKVTYCLHFVSMFSLT